MEVFDGFIAAIASEFKLKFHKDSEGAYTTLISFDNNRSQKVLITLSKDEVGDRIVNYYSIVGKLKGDFGEFYKFALQTNSSLLFGAMALVDDTLILRDSMLLQECDPRRFMKSLTYIAAKADEIEEMLLKKNVS